MSDDAQEPLDGLKLIAEAITEYFGEPCADYDAECACCVAWVTYNGLAYRPEEPPSTFNRPMEK